MATRRRSTARERSAEARPKRPPRTPDQTREALIASAAALFAKHGLDGPSLDDICADAGLTRGAFYVHFADREALLVAVMDRLGAPLLDELFAEGEGGLAGAVARFVEASASGRYPLMPAGGIRPYQLLDACARSPVVRERYVGLVEASTRRIAALVRDGQTEGIVRADVDPEHAARLAMAIIVGLQTLADLGVAPRLEQLAPDLVQLLAKP